MAQSSRFWTTDGASPDAPLAGYSADQFAAFIKKAFGDGVLAGIEGELAVSGVTSPVTVAAGACFGAGYFYESTANEDVPIDSPVIGTTGFRIVVRFIWATPEGRLYLNMSSDGVASPPAAVQTEGTTWDITVATGTITTAGVIVLSTAEKDWAAYSSHVVTAMIDNDAVTSAKILAGAVSEAKIATGAVTEGKLGALAVTEAKLGALAVTTAKIEERACIQGKIGDGSITNIKIGTGAVSEDKIAPGAVTNTKLGNLSIDGEKIINGAVIESKIGTGAVTVGKIGTGAVTSAKILDSTITGDDIAYLAINHYHLELESIWASNIKDDNVVRKKLGAGAPRMWTRQGGSSTNWNSAGTNSYVLDYIEMQCGAIRWDLENAEVIANFVVTFPHAYTDGIPLVIAQIACSIGIKMHVGVIETTKTTVTFQVWRYDAGGITAGDIHWQSIGSAVT